MTEQWSQVARNWEQLGSPLRPAAQDVGFYQVAIDDWCAEHPRQAPHGLIFGVTPELYRLDWPDRKAVRAVDRTLTLIECVWPGPRENVLHCDWLEAALAPGSIDIALFDGGVHLLDYPDGQRRLAELLAEWLPAGGRLAVRLFLPPARPDTPEQVMADLDAGRIRDLNCLKLRLGGALLRSPRQGVRMHDIWRLVSDRAGGDLQGLADRLGWSLEHLAVIEAYRGSPVRYYFVTLEQAVELFTPAFALERVNYPDYEMGRLCPTLLFVRR